MLQIDGIDCSALGLRDLRSRMSIIPQVRCGATIWSGPRSGFSRRQSVTRSPRWSIV